VCKQTAQVPVIFEPQCICNVNKEAGEKSLTNVGGYISVYITTFSVTSTFIKSKMEEIFLVSCTKLIISIIKLLHIVQLLLDFTNNKDTLFSCK
jgi:hypothetical protein